MYILAMAISVFLLGTAGVAIHATENAPRLELPENSRDGRVDPKLPETDETLGERLESSNGVIRPPDEGVVPDMRVPPKEPGAGANMPVIPPRKLPDTQAQPK